MNYPWTIHQTIYYCWLYNVIQLYHAFFPHKCQENALNLMDFKFPMFFPITRTTGTLPETSSGKPWSSTSAATPSSLLDLDLWGFYDAHMDLIIYIYIYLEPKWALFWRFWPIKLKVNHPKEGSFGFQVYIYIWICLRNHQKISRDFHGYVYVYVLYVYNVVYKYRLTIDHRSWGSNDQWRFKSQISG